MDDLTRSTKAMLDAAINARMPVMLVGAPGTGKTATVKQIAKERGYTLITLVGSRMDPTDVVGLPKGEEVGKDEYDEPIFATVNLSPHWQVEILRKKKVILFLDEWGNSPGAIQAAFLTLLQDREFANGHKFPKETIVLGASNPPEEGADSFEMALPTTNRIFWISWSPTMDSWVEGMNNAWGEDVSPQEMAWKKKIARFIKDNPGWLQKLPEDTETTQVYGLNPNNASDMAVFRYAWPSRRSWDNLSRVLSEHQSDGQTDDTYVQDLIAQGIVGYAATSAFRDWLRKNDKISPADVLKDPSIIDWMNVSIDDSNLIFRAVMEMVDEKNVDSAMDFFEYVADAGRADLGGPYVPDFLKKIIGRGFSEATVNRCRARVRELIAKYKEVGKHSK